MTVPPLTQALGIPGVHAVTLFDPAGPRVLWWAGETAPTEQESAAAVTLAAAAAGLVLLDGNGGDELSDILLTSVDAFHVLRLVGTEAPLVAHLTLRRTGANLAMARREFGSILADYARELNPAGASSPPALASAAAFNGATFGSFNGPSPSLGSLNGTAAASPSPGSLNGTAAASPPVDSLNGTAAASPSPGSLNGAAPGSLDGASLGSLDGAGLDPLYGVAPDSLDGVTLDPLHGAAPGSPNGAAPGLAIHPREIGSGTVDLSDALRVPDSELSDALRVPDTAEELLPRRNRIDPPETDEASDLLSLLGRPYVTDDTVLDRVLVALRAL